MNKEKISHNTTSEEVTKTQKVNIHCSITTLNINLNFSMRRYRLTDWIRKWHPSFCGLQETHIMRQYTRSPQPIPSYMEKNSKAFPVKSGTRQGFHYSHPCQHSTWNSKTNEGGKGDTNRKGRSQNIFVDYTILYLKTYSTPKLL